MKQIVDDSLWEDRLNAADRRYREWESKFQCDVLDRYLEGFQWKNTETSGYNPYTINKFFETIEIKLAQFIPQFPHFVVMTRPANEDQLEPAANSAHLKEDLLNTIIENPSLNFSLEMEQAYKESFIRFGVVEVGYEADWIINPNAPKPLLGKDAELNLNDKERRKIIQEPPELPQNERIFVRHIPAKSFRTGGTDNSYLNRCGFCGYFSYVNKDDLLALPKLMNRDKINTAVAVQNYPDDEMSDVEYTRQRYNALKIWHIWDMKARYRFLILDSPKVTVFQRKFTRLPLYDIRPNRRLTTSGFYPVPPSFHWLSPQNEYNETREMLRAHRRRFVRKFQVMEGMCDDEEIEKFESGPDGALIKVKRENAILPIENADLGQSLAESVQISADDLNRISGTSDESRGVADRTTATQANIVNQRTALRETKERDRVVNWYCGIGREILLTVKENFSGKTVVKLTSPEGEGFGQSVQTVGPAFKFISAEDLDDGYDFRIDVDLTTMSSTAQQEEKQKLLEYTAFLQQNPFVAFSPYLVREAAYRIGYRNEKAIAEFQQMSLLMELARMNQLKQQAGISPAGPQMPENGNSSQQIMQGATPPAMEQIRNQLGNQLLPQAAGGGQQ